MRVLAALVLLGGVAHAQYTPQQEALLNALIQVESGGRDDAVGDGGRAIGCLQIWEPYWKDAVERSGIKGVYKDCYTRKYAKRIVDAYMTRYAREKWTDPKKFDAEHCARIHNGGPTGYKKTATVEYWKKGAAHVDVPGPPILAYHTLATQPHLHVGETVRVVAQVHSLVEDWNPYITRFSPSEYRSLTAWSDEQKPWIQSDYDTPEARFFVKRSAALAQVLGEARPHERFELTVVVRELFGGRPWIEIVSGRKLRHHVPEGAVLHAIRAQRFIDQSTFLLAANELERAMAAPLPTHVERELNAWRERCLELQTEFEAAREERSKR